MEEIIVIITKMVKGTSFEEFVGWFFALSGLFLFLKDPLRRWTFFGFRPTAVIPLVDPKVEEALLIKKEGENWWSFAQGGLFEKDINAAVANILERELGLPRNSFDLRYPLVLGAQRISGDDYRLKRPILGAISLKKLRGKGYIACYCLCRKADVLKNFSLGPAISDCRFFPLKEIPSLLLQNKSAEDTPWKQKNVYRVILKTIADILKERLSSFVKK